MRLTADGAGFPPAIGVYVGNSVSNLALADFFSSSQTNIINANGTYNVVTTNGVFTNLVTIMALFNANSGTIHHIALAGREKAGDNIVTNFGSYHFRLNGRSISLTNTNLIYFHTTLTHPTICHLRRTPSSAILGRQRVTRCESMSQLLQARDCGVLASLVALSSPRVRSSWVFGRPMERRLWDRGKAAW